MRRGRGPQSDPRPDHRLSDKRQPISKASDAQREKCRDLPCVGCGRRPTETSKSDPMHLAAVGFRGGCTHPDCTVPGCRWCHRDFDKDVGGRKLDLSTKVSGPNYVAELTHMLAHYDGDWTAMGERLSGKRVVVLEHERARELGL